MVSLKKQKGFTIVELLIVIIIIGILATLVIVTFTGIQAKARDSKRQTDLNAVDSHVEAFFAQYGFYPSLADLQSATFLSTFLKGFDPAALTDPKGGALSATVGGTNYGYVASGSDAAGTCSNTTATTITSGVPQDNGCSKFVITADLEGGGTFVKQSNT
ncbi:MAG TPA: prepilin-type N-terminal cleavage/methylation domain-containing protein [Candidatus Saccharimonadales bacterium]|nr:prepilin-type N-terminal cleavage/methylation domain-containing protein [Candidatus Saccharimonadales bacterium]